jgi:TIR domain
MGGIFISYRRDDVAGQVGRLFGRLAAHYGEDFIFMDVESIRPSQQFESVIKNRIAECDVMLLAIGSRWEAEHTQSQASKDFVGMELAAALGAKRPLCPLLIDRREPPEVVGLSDEFQQILHSQMIEIRHSTFDSDVEALIAGLEKQGIRPPPSFGRQRVEDALVAAGWPYSWLGAMSRTLSPLVVAALAAAVLAAAGWLVYQAAYEQGSKAGSEAASAAAEKEITKITESYEEQFKKDRRETLQITGLVTDGTRGIEEAEITLTNMRNKLEVSDRTDSRGVYNVDLEEIEVVEGDVVRFAVAKPPFRPTTESIRYYDGFREFRAVLRK